MKYAHKLCVFGHTKCVVLACCECVITIVPEIIWRVTHYICCSLHLRIDPLYFQPLISLPCQWIDSPNLQIINYYVTHLIHWHALPWARTTIIKFYINCCIHHYDVIKQLVHASAAHNFQEARVTLGCTSSNSYTLFWALLTSRVLNVSTLMHELIVKCWRWSYTSEVVGNEGLTVIIHFMKVHSQKFHTNRNIANNIKFKIDESSGV